MTRWSPKSFCSPSVMRKTPPSAPMSFPNSTTLGSSSTALRSPRLMAAARVVVVFSAPGCLGRGPSSPWRWRAVASWSNLRNRTMDRYMVIRSVISRVSSSYPFGDRRSPLGLIICTG